MKSVGAFFSRCLSYGAVGIVFLTVGGISLAIIGSVMTTPETRAEAGCFLGFEEWAGEECLQDRFDAARAAMEADMAALRRQIEADRAVLDAERVRLARELSDLESMILDTEVVLLEAPSPTGAGYVVVAASFRDPTTRSDLIGASCFYAKDTGGPDPRLPLGRLSSSRVLAQSTVDPARLAAFELDAGDYQAAQRACPWPQS